MLDISNNNIITMTRGDNVTIPLHLFHGTSDKLTNISYFPNINDKIVFSIMEPNQSFEDAIVKKIYYANDVNKETGKIKIKMESYETQFLAPGMYYYTVKLLKKSPWAETPDSDGRVDTVLGMTKFYLID